MLKQFSKYSLCFFLCVFSYCAYAAEPSEVIDELAGESREELVEELREEPRIAVGAAREFNAGLGADSLLQVFVALVTVVFIIFALSMVLKKFNMLSAGRTDLIKVLGGMSLSSKDRLLIVQVGDEQILISACPGNINKIHTLATPINTEKPGSKKNGTNSSANSNDEKSFSNFLKTVTSGQGS